MSKSTRYFLIGAATVVLLGLGTGLVAYYNGGLAGAGQTSDADLAYLPANAGAVGYADVRTIMGSQLTQKLRQMLPTGEEKDKIQAELGVDLERDIDSVAVAYVGGASPFDGALVVVRGRFNTGQIEALATQHGATVIDYNGHRLLTMPRGREMAGEGVPAATHHPTAGVAFLEQGVIAFGEESALKGAIDGAATGNDIRKNADIMAVVNDVRYNGNAWFVGKFDALTNNAAIPAAVREHLPAVDVFAVSLHVNGGLRGALRADARDDKAAEQLRDVVRGAVAAGKLVSGQSKEVDTLLNSLQITGSGKTVGVAFSLPAEFLDVLNGIAAARGLTASPQASPEIKK
jgi:hypothetical protein